MDAADCLPHTLGPSGIGAVEMLDLPVDDVRRHALHRTRDVIEKTLALPFVEQRLGEDVVDGDRLR